jgi:hypothetical protein
MSKKRFVVDSPDELDEMERNIGLSAGHTSASLRTLASTTSGLDALASLKFKKVGCDPLDADRPLNFIEQLNQSFTYLASIKGTRWLFEHHGDKAPFVINLGTTRGFDIHSVDLRVIAEAFAVTHPDSNQKIKKDVARLLAADADYRYVFYLSPVASKRTHPEAVHVVHLGRL